MTYLEWKENYRLERIKRNEIWKDVPNYEGLYQISNIGNLRSLDRIIKTRNQGGECFKKYNGRKIIGNISNKGYIVSTLSKDGIQEKVQIHQLVAIVFLNHKPCGLKIVVDHRDYNPLNNMVYNLQLISNRENCSKDQFRHNRSSKYTGVHWNKQRSKWRVQIQINKNNITLGFYEKEKEANNIYQKALLNSI